MKPEIKAMNDLLDALTELAGSLATSHGSTIRGIEKAIDRALPGFPRQSVEILTGYADEMLRVDASRGALVIASFVGILRQQYDGTPLTLSEWRQLRDLISDCADELEMDVVTYAMSLIMDYGAL